MEEWIFENGELVLQVNRDAMEDETMPPPPSPPAPSSLLSPSINDHLTPLSPHPPPCERNDALDIILEDQGDDVSIIEGMRRDFNLLRSEVSKCIQSNAKVPPPQPSEVNVYAHMVGQQGKGKRDGKVDLEREVKYTNLKNQLEETKNFLREAREEIGVY